MRLLASRTTATLPVLYRAGQRRISPLKRCECCRSAACAAFHRFVRAQHSPALSNRRGGSAIFAPSFDPDADGTALRFAIRLADKIAQFSEAEGAGVEIRSHVHPAVLGVLLRQHLLDQRNGGVRRLQRLVDGRRCSARPKSRREAGPRCRRTAGGLGENSPPSSARRSRTHRRLLATSSNNPSTILADVLSASMRTGRRGDRGSDGNMRSPPPDRQSLTAAVRSHYPAFWPASWFARISAMSIGPSENSPRAAFRVRSRR